MSFVRHLFKSGEKLLARQLNELEEQVENNEKNIPTSAELIEGTLSFFGLKGKLFDVSGFYKKPEGGIPKTDLAKDVQDKLDNVNASDGGTGTGGGVQMVESYADPDAYISNNRCFQCPDQFMDLEDVKVYVNGNLVDPSGYTLYKTGKLVFKANVNYSPSQVKFVYKKETVADRPYANTLSNQDITPFIVVNDPGLAKEDLYSIEPDPAGAGTALRLGYNKNVPAEAGRFKIQMDYPVDATKVVEEVDVYYPLAFIRAFSSYDMTTDGISVLGAWCPFGVDAGGYMQSGATVNVSLMRDSSGLVYWQAQSGLRVVDPSTKVESYLIMSESKEKIPVKSREWIHLKRTMETGNPGDFELEITDSDGTHTLTMVSALSGNPAAYIGVCDEENEQGRYGDAAIPPELFLWRKFNTLNCCKLYTSTRLAQHIISNGSLYAFFKNFKCSGTNTNAHVEVGAGITGDYDAIWQQVNQNTNNISSLFESNQKKYEKPEGGIPESDLSEDVQEKLNKEATGGSNIGIYEDADGDLVAGPVSEGTPSNPPSSGSGLSAQEIAELKRIFNIEPKEDAGKIWATNATGAGWITPNLPAGGGSSIFANVKDFGAVGDGNADDTTAIQSALNSAYKQIYLPAGTYKVTSKLTMPYNKFLFGDGTNNTFIQSYVQNDWTIVYGPSYQYTEYKGGVSNLRIQSNLASEKKPNGLYLNAGGDFHDLHFATLGQAIGRSSSYIDMATFRRITIGYCMPNGKYVFDWTGSGDAILIDQLKFEPYANDTTQYNGIRIYSCNGGSIVNSIINASLTVERCKGLRIESNHFENRPHRIRISGSNVPFSNNMIHKNQKSSGSDILLIADAGNQCDVQLNGNSFVHTKATLNEATEASSNEVETYGSGRCTIFSVHNRRALNLQNVSGYGWNYCTLPLYEGEPLTDMAYGYNKSIQGAIPAATGNTAVVDASVQNVADLTWNANAAGRCNYKLYYMDASGNEVASSLKQLTGGARTKGGAGIAIKTQGLFGMLKIYRDTGSGFTVYAVVALQSAQYLIDNGVSLSGYEWKAVA